MIKRECFRRSAGTAGRQTRRTGLTLAFCALGLSAGAFPHSQAQAADAIGQLVEATGDVRVERAGGGMEQLAFKSFVYQDDTVATGAAAKASIKFTDGTALALSANARIVLDEYLYKPGSSRSRANLDMVEGAFVFVTGSIAKFGSFQVDTPVATMGIRGTTPVVRIAGSEVSFGIAQDPNGRVGRYTLTQSAECGTAIVDATGRIYQTGAAGPQGCANPVEASFDTIPGAAALVAAAHRAWRASTFGLNQNQQRDTDPGERQSDPEPDQDSDTDPAQ